MDALAGAVALVALAGVVWSPKLSNTVAWAMGSVKPVLVSVDVRRLSTANRSKLIADALDHGKTSIVIRNQPAGSVRLVEIQDISSKLTTVLPDGRWFRGCRRAPGSGAVRAQGQATVSGSTW